MTDHIEATFYEDGSTYVDNRTTGNSTTFNQDSPLHVKLSTLGITAISEEELHLFKKAWNEADRSQMYGGRVTHALEVAFGLKVHEDKEELPTEAGSVIHVRLFDRNYWDTLILAKDGMWRDGDIEFSPESLKAKADKIEVVL